MTVLRGMRIFSLAILSTSEVVRERLNIHLDFRYKSYTIVNLTRELKEERS